MKWQITPVPGEADSRSLISLGKEIVWRQRGLALTCVRAHLAAAENGGVRWSGGAVLRNDSGPWRGRRLARRG